MLQGCLACLSPDLLEELLELLVDDLVDLLGKLLRLAGDGRESLDDLTRDNVEVALNGLLELLEGDHVVGGPLDGVATLRDNLRVVGLATTVEGEQVGSVTGDIGQGVLGGNADQVLLELGRSERLGAVAAVLCNPQSSRF